MNRRFRPSEELRRRSTLHCEVPRSGSYTIPIRVNLGVEHVLHGLHGLLMAVALRQYENLASVIPDSSLRDRALLQMKKYFPKPGERWGFGFSTGGTHEAFIETRCTRTIERWYAQDEPQGAVMTVTGELIGIDFAENK